jgi:non-ribosomal peptide synthetase component E (peptide arylation enzyme)
MIVTTEPKQIEVCDICKQDVFLLTCDVCGHRFCFSCEGIITGCWVSPRICVDCGQRKDVRAICKTHSDEITPIIERRRMALRSLRQAPE